MAEREQETRTALAKLLAIAKEWRQTCVCATADDNNKMDTAIELAEEVLRP